MSGVSRGQTVPVSALRLGRQLGAGGQGQVFEVLNHPDLVYKKYLFSRIDAMALAELVELPDTLATPEAALLLASSAWPLASVRDGGTTTGFLMPRVPAHFMGTTAAGPKLRELQYLLYPPKPFWQEIVPLDTEGRYLVVAKFARLLAVLQRNKIVLGDISMNNLLWSAGADPEIFLIDCDGARRMGGQSPLPQPDTPDWTDPFCPSVDSDLDSDAYKLALVVGRVLAATADVRPGDPLRLPGELSDRTAQTIREQFSRAAGARQTRPTAADWYTAVTTGRSSIRLGSPPPLRQRPAPQQPLAPLDDGSGKRSRGSIPLTPPRDARP